VSGTAISRAACHRCYFTSLPIDWVLEFYEFINHSMERGMVGWLCFVFLHFWCPRGWIFGWMQELPGRFLGLQESTMSAVWDHPAELITNMQTREEIREKSPDWLCKLVQCWLHGPKHWRCDIVFEPFTIFKKGRKLFLRGERELLTT